MPNYDFRCTECRKLSRHFFTYAEYDQAQPTCPHCGSTRLERRINRIALAKSEESRLDTLSDDSMLSGLDEEDPRSLGRFMRKMSQEMGEDMGEEFNEVIDRLEKGESPEAIEAAMPELAEGGSPADDFDFN